MKFHIFKLPGIAFIAFTGSFSILLSGCSPSRLSENECQKLLLQNTRVIAEDEAVPEELKEIMLKSILNIEIKKAFVQECMKTRSRDRYKCEMSSASWAELKDCSKKFPSLPEEK